MSHVVNGPEEVTDVAARTAFDRDAAGLFGDIAALEALADNEHSEWYDRVACARYGYEENPDVEYIG